MDVQAIKSKLTSVIFQLRAVYEKISAIPFSAYFATLVIVAIIANRVLHDGALAALCILVLFVMFMIRGIFWAFQILAFLITAFFAVFAIMAIISLVFSR